MGTAVRGAATGAESVLAQVLRRYLRMTGRHSSCVYLDSTGRAAQLEKMTESLVEMTDRGRPVLLTYWISDALVVAMLPFVEPSLFKVVGDLKCLVDDTFGGRVAAQYIESLGGRHTTLALPDDPERLRQVHGVISQGGSCAFPVDGGGPYRQVGTGLIALASSLDAAIMPLAASATRKMPLGHRSKVQLPLPGGKLVVATAGPITVAREADRRRMAAVVKQSLDALDGAVRQA